MKILLAVFILGIFIAVALIFSLEATANPTVFASMPKFEIESPVSGTLNSGTVEFKVMGQVMERYYVNESGPRFYCYLNHEEFVINATYAGNTSDGWLIFKGEATRYLPEGNYTFDVWQISCSQIARALNAETVKFEVLETNQWETWTTATIILLVVIAFAATMLVYRKRQRNQR